MCFDELFKFITGGNEKEPKGKKTKKKKKKEKEKECCEIDQNFCDVVDGFKTCVNKSSIGSSKCQKIKSTISEDWLNKLRGQYINSKNNCFENK